MKEIKIAVIGLGLLAIEFLFIAYFTKEPSWIFGAIVFMIASSISFYRK